MEDKSFALELLQEEKKQNKRLFLALIISILLLFLSNICWLIYINQYDYSVIETTQEANTNDNSPITQNVGE